MLTYPFEEPVCSSWFRRVGVHIYCWARIMGGFPFEFVSRRSCPSWLASCFCLVVEQSLEGLHCDVIFGRRGDGLKRGSPLNQDGSDSSSLDTRNQSFGLVLQNCFQGKYEGNFLCNCFLFYV